MVNRTSTFQKWIHFTSWYLWITFPLPSFLLLFYLFYHLFISSPVFRSLSIPLFTLFLALPLSTRCFSMRWVCAPAKVYVDTAVSKLLAWSSLHDQVVFDWADALVCCVFFVWSMSCKNRNALRMRCYKHVHWCISCVLLLWWPLTGNGALCNFLLAINIISQMRPWSEISWI